MHLRQKRQVFPSPSLTVARSIPATMEAVITMIVVVIVVTILIVVDASDNMLPVVDIMTIPSGVVGMMVGLALLMIGMMLMVDPMLVII